jgi:hypothetical protein
VTSSASTVTIYSCRCEVARKDKDVRFTALLHHVTPGLLLGSFDGLKKDAAPGVDGVTWRDYERGALPRLVALRDRVQEGKYRALPSRRVYIPKADARTSAAFSTISTGDGWTSSSGTGSRTRGSCGWS